MLPEKQIYDISFTHPMRMLIAGPSGSGKTTIVEKILRYKEEIFDIQFGRIVYVTGSVFPEYLEKYNVEKQASLSAELLDSFDASKNNLLVVDDAMNDITNDTKVSDLFTKRSHHQSISIILILQNLFPRTKYARDISLNANYFILMKNTRETQQVKTLARQIDGARSNFIIKCYVDATGKAFGYLLLDLNQTTEREVRVRTNIFPDELPQIAYMET